MSHMVIFQTPDGNPGYNQFEELTEAVSFVENLRNEQNVETARIFALEEIKFAFKSYFRVEVDPPMVGPAGSTSAPSLGVVPPPSGAAFDQSVPAPAFEAPATVPTFEAPQPYEAPQGFEAAPTGTDDASPIGTVSPIGVQPPFAGAEQPTGTDAPTFMAPPPPAQESQTEPTRRGLFGR